MSFTQNFSKIFHESILNYHLQEALLAECHNPYHENTLDFLLYHKNWIDNIQWHLEDEIRRPDIMPEFALDLKRKIDKWNDVRTNIVEKIDDFLFEEFKEVILHNDSRLATESPAWAIDRLSILSLKIYHMDFEANRAEDTEEYRQNCGQKLAVLKLQEKDLCLAIDQLIAGLKSGDIQYKRYRQMKMYNDEKLNPVLRGFQK
ncbi:MAG: DUF4254 domain-containing protein [Chitinophagales bacterium]|jgi:hypothetical protein|nr:DUF4254 domain-containing protein [Chitinophagales bacterium]